MTGDRFDYEPEYDRPVRPDEPEPEVFFGERGFALETHEGDGVAWADLVARDRPDFRVANYGRGADPRRAAFAAMRRWIVEQAE